MLNVNMLWTQPFQQWALSTIDRASSTLTTLHLQYEGPVLELKNGDNLAAGPWTIGLAALDLPALTSFSFSPSMQVSELRPHARFNNPISWFNLLRFLYRHPTIKKLRLLDFQVPPYAIGLMAPCLIFQSATGGPPPAFLPLLESLATDAQAIQWIITEQRGASQALRRIILPVYLAYVDLFDTSLWDFIQSRRLHDRVSISFAIMHSNDLSTWFNSQLGTPISQLAGLQRVRIESLGWFTVKIWHHACACNWMLNESFARWLDLFPDVEEVEIVEDREGVALWDRRVVCATFNKFCPRVKRLVVGSKVIDLEGDPQLDPFETAGPCRFEGRSVA